MDYKAWYTLDVDPKKYYADIMAAISIFSDYVQVNGNLHASTITATHWIAVGLNVYVPTSYTIKDYDGIDNYINTLGLSSPW